MRIPYLVIFNNEKSFIYTDKRKVKKILNENNDVKVYFFKTIDKYNYWKDIYQLHKDGEESEAEMFENNGDIYSKLGCFIMEKLAEADWNNSIKYPSNGWHICSVCGSITNEIDKCYYCDEFVCWDCASNVIDNSAELGNFCSYDCYRNYGEKEYGIPYNPELEAKKEVCDRIDDILKRFEQKQLFNILIKTESFINEYDKDELRDAKLKYINMTEGELLNILNNEDIDEIYKTLMESYEDETNDYLADILDGEAFINNLDPNDPADEWYFED